MADRTPMGRWPELDTLFEQALALPPNERAAFLSEACDGDAELRAELDHLLAAHGDSGSFLQNRDDWLGSVAADPTQATPDTMPAGRHVAHYLIEHLLGAGGMGVVYRARDTKLGRLVTLKFLQPHLVADPEASTRFVHEAKAASALDHPNICTIYEVGETADGQVYIAMAYYGGETLRARMARGPIPTDEALRFASAIGSGLARAHEAGIVHRDLKPANVMLTERGEVKLLDFGIAKLVGGADLTRTGARLGTVAYMSPEQATGGEVDHRTDIWALGVLLYEMLTGTRPFKGDHEQAVIYGILNEEPSAVSQNHPGVDAVLDALTARALAKTPEARYDSMSQFVSALDDARGVSQPSAGYSGGSTVSATTKHPSRAFSTRGLTAAVVSVLAVLTVAVFVSRTLTTGGQENGGPLAIRPLTTFDGPEWTPSWSPDGSQIAYAHSLGGSADIYVMSVGGGEPRVVADGPHDEMTPRWSPDGTQLAFVLDEGTGSAIHLVPATGGSKRRLVETNMLFLERWDAINSIGSSPWSPDGRRIAFSRMQPTGEVAVWTVDIETRQETQTTFPSSAGVDLYPAWSNDGEWIAFSRIEGGGENVWRVPADGGEARPVTEGAFFDVGPAWTPDDRHIVFYSDRAGSQSLWEVTLRSGSLLQLTSGPDNDMTPAISSAGRLAYVSFSHTLDLIWLDIGDSATEGTPLTRSNTRDNFAARVAPDGRQIVFFSNRSGSYDIWLLDRESREERALTDDAATDFLPDWSPDGQDVVFMSNRDGTGFHLWKVAASGGPPQRLTDQPARVLGDPTDVHYGGPRWAPDGESIGYINVAGAGLTLTEVDPNGGEARPTDLSGLRSFDWYLDSHRVVFTRQASDGDGTVELIAANLETGAEVVLLRGPITEIDVAPDGSAVAYVDAPSHFDMNLFRLPLSEPDGPDGLPHAGGPPRRLTDGNGIWHVHAGGWAPDGGAVVFTRDEDRADVFVIDNYRQ